MDHAAVERSIWIAAPRERVWQAISAPEQIATWLLPPALGAQLTRDADGKLLVVLGPMEVPIAQFENLAPHQHLTLRGLPDQQIAATFTLRELDSGTQVSVALTGFEQFAAHTRHDRLRAVRRPHPARPPRPKYAGLGADLAQSSGRRRGG